MSKILSRTVHVTVTVAVEVPVDEANTNAKAVEYAKNSIHVEGGQQFDTVDAKVFDTWTESDQEKHEREMFRRKVGIN